MAPRTKTPVIIDTDPGVDDIIAISCCSRAGNLGIHSIFWKVSLKCYMCQRLNLTLGNTDIQSSYLNVLKTYQVLTRHFAQHPSHQSRFPNFSSIAKPLLARGSDGPLQGDLHSAQYFHGRDGLGGITQRHPDLNLKEFTRDHPQLVLTDKSGVDIALDLIRTSPPRTITYIALGPLTNLAHMIRQNGRLVRERIGRIICMGGALDVPGNISPVAEFNFFADPFAVKELLLSDSGLPLDRFVLLPLDVTTPHELPFPLYNSQIDPTFDSSTNPSALSDKSPLIHFTSSFLEKTREIMLQFGKDAIELHDIVAVWCAIENPPVNDFNMAPGWEGRKRIFDIERSGEITRGMLVVDRRMDESAYTPGANRAQVQSELDKVALFQGNGTTAALPVQVEVEHAPSKPNIGSGVFCVTSTPGSGPLLHLLLQRVARKS